MNFWKHSLIAAAAFFGIATTVVYTSCETDSCTELKCKNGGSCADNFCRCRAGYEGAECEIRTADTFLGVYPGSIRCDGFPQLVDTLTIFMRSSPMRVGIVRSQAVTDTIYGDVASSPIKEIRIADRNTGSATEHFSIVLNDKNIQFYIQSVNNSTQAKTICTFVGPLTSRIAP